MRNPERWGPLRERYMTARPRRMLSLDGGGIRGLITLGMLERLESRLREQSTGDPAQFRLGDWFDYIAGTSTGAILATGLARGMAVEELIRFYLECGEEMFHKTRLLKRWKSLYEADPLRNRLKSAFGENSTLEPQHLRCLLLIVVRNASTDSPWPISSNPDAKYNDPELGDCNLRVPLWQLVRASTAAPIFFPPETIVWNPDDPSRSSVFVDGGLTPYNNPSFLLYRMATQASYRLEWPVGERNLLLISIGTGAAAEMAKLPESGVNVVSQLADLPGRLMYAVSVDQDIICRTVGRCVHGAHIDSELADMKDVPAANLAGEHGGRAFSYARYNADLSAAGLSALGLGHLDPHAVQRMDGVDQMHNLLEIGRAAGESINLADFGPFTGQA